MIKILTMQQILESETLKAELEKVKTEAQIEQLFEKYDFSEFDAGELGEEELYLVNAGVKAPQLNLKNPLWLQQVLKKVLKQSSKKNTGSIRIF